MELSIPYVLTGHDGSRVVVGNSDVAKADPDWIGYLDPENGITGLLDGAEPRAAMQPVPLGEGVQIGRVFSGERSGTVQGMIDPNATTAVMESHAAKLRRFAQAARQLDGVMSWTPSGAGALPRMIRVRHISGRPDVRGRRPKTYLLALTSRDPVVLSRDEALHTIGPMNGSTGISSQIANLGDAPTWPRHYIDGPINDPQIVLYDAFSVHAIEVARINLGVDLASTERVAVIPERGTILRGLKGDYGFEHGTAGWSTAAHYYANVPTSLSRVANTLGGAGGWIGQVVSPATIITGPSYDVIGPFFKGRTYIMTVRVRGNTAGRWMRAGVWSKAEDHQQTEISATNAFQDLVVSWSPPQTVARAKLYVVNRDAIAHTWQLDELSFRESGKQYDYARMGFLNSPADISGDAGIVGPARTAFFQLPPRPVYLGFGCTSSGSESYLRTVFNHAWP